MVFPHPASRKHIRLDRFLWRYFTGHHLDGKPRTNATWFKRGTAPHHHVNWWSAKPRAHRMLWRWGMFLGPIAIYIGYKLAPSFRINLVVLIFLAGLPYGFHHVTQKFLALVPQTKVVFVQNTVPMEHVDAEIDPISTGDDIEQENIEGILEMDITKELEASDDVPPKRGANRSSKMRRLGE